MSTHYMIEVTIKEVETDDNGLATCKSSYHKYDRFDLWCVHMLIGTMDHIIKSLTESKEKE